MKYSWLYMMKALKNWFQKYTMRAEHIALAVVLQIKIYTQRPLHT
jgi:hypothetical protein